MSWKIKTVLGNALEWDTSKIPGRGKKGTWSGKDDQLWRCRKTKKFEASLLANLPRGSCFVDAGAHFGDTIITMALHARETLGRGDLRFVAFEPNRRKAAFIEECAAANGFDEETLRVISCVLGDITVAGGARARREHEKDWCKYDGRTSYCNCDDESVTANAETTLHYDDEDDSAISSSSDSSTSSDPLLDIHRLDDYFDILHPIGFLHIDVEGWEAKVLAGASKLLTASVDATTEASHCYILAETFNCNEARRRGPGFSRTHEDDILQVMSKHPHFARGDDVVDGERNLFFESGGER